MVVLKGLEGIGRLDQNIGIQNIRFLHGVFSFSLQKFDSLHNENSRFFRKSGAKQRTSSGKPADAIQAICQEII